MHTFISTLAALFVAHASPMKVDCYAYHGNWTGAPAQVCGTSSAGSHELTSRHCKKDA